MTISHVSYADTVIAIADLTYDKLVCLKKKEEILDEVIITPNSVFDFLLTSIKKTEEKLILPIKLNAYYKEFIKNNNSFIRFCDADVIYHLRQDKKENLSINGSVVGSRAYRIPAVEANEIDFEIISPIGYQKALKFYKPSKIGRFTNLDAPKKYDYFLQEYKKSYAVRVNPKEHEDGLFEANILINKYDSTVTSINFLIPEHRSHLTKERNAIVAKVKITSNSGYLYYSYTPGGNIFLSHSRLEYTLSVKNKNTDDLLSFISGVNIYEIPEDQEPFPKSKAYKNKSIYKRGTDYLSAYWLEKSLITLTEKEKKIIQEISNLNSE
ncbi:MAG: hypothetical protein OXH57_01625 [Ekhidna sp.]|nr:hypothetical protein [Ekhidna sp.]